MKIVKTLITPTFLLFVLFACSDDELAAPDTMSMEEEEEEIENEMLGEYIIEGRHISGIHTFYDSIGNILGQGYDTTYITDEAFSIAESVSPDTFLVSNIRKSFDKDGIEVKAIMSNDSMVIVHDLTNGSYLNDYIRGKIWTVGDTVYLDYKWDTSDTWSAGALPEAGHVECKGIKLE